MSALHDHQEPSAHEIRDELSRVLASADFVASKQLTSFLRYVVDESLAGRADSIKQRNVALHALDRDASYDPRTDPIVRMVAGKLRRALSRFYAADGAQNPIRIEVPKGGYRPVFRKADVERPSIGNDISVSMIDRHRFAIRPVLAVVPFVVFTRGPREQYLADSMGQDLSVQLSKFTWFEVVDYLAARALCDGKYAPIDVASRLHADFCLTGTIWSRPDSYRVTIQLTDTTFGKLVWANQFDLRVDDEEPRQHDRIVEQTVAKVGDIFGVMATAIVSRSRQKTHEQLTLCEAVLGNLRYQSHLADWMFARAFQDAERAIAADPDFAWGWAALALLNIDNYILDVNRHSHNAADRSLFCVRQALRADPTCGLAHFSLGVYHLAHGEIEECVVAADRVLEFSRCSPFEIAGAGSLLAMAGEAERSQALIDQAQEFNARLPGWVHWATAINALTRGEQSRAVAVTQKFTLPECFWDHLFRANTLLEAGETELADMSLSRGHELRPVLSQRPRETISKLLPFPEMREELIDAVRRNPN